jgi:hypothetical protein
VSFSVTCLIRVESRAARFFLAKLTKTGENIPNEHEVYQMAITNTKWSQNIPNGNKIYQHILFRGNRKYTHVGMKTHHLATLVESP